MAKLPDTVAEHPFGHLFLDRNVRFDGLISPTEDDLLIEDLILPPKVSERPGIQAKFDDRKQTFLVHSSLSVTALIKRSIVNSRRGMILNLESKSACGSPRWDSDVQFFRVSYIDQSVGKQTALRYHVRGYPCPGFCITTRGSSGEVMAEGEVGTGEYMEGKESNGSIDIRCPSHIRTTPERRNATSRISET
jgi:hypothetical protein